VLLYDLFSNLLLRHYLKLIELPSQSQSLCNLRGKIGTLEVQLVRVPSWFGWVGVPLHEFPAPGLRGIASLLLSETI